jgi:purine-binding chemotaxis protein CheW
MRAKFDMPEVEPQMYTAIVIITIEGKNIGFIVDKVEEVVNVDDENISPPPEFGSNIDTRFIENMAKQKNKVVMILDLVALFGEEELSLVQNLSKTISDKG